MNIDSSIVSAFIGAAATLAGVVVTLFATGLRDEKIRKRVQVEKKLQALKKLRSLLEKGITLYHQAGGLNFEIEYNPEDKSQYNMVLMFIENNSKIEEQLIEAELPSSRREIAQFLENVTELKTQVIEGRAKGWLRSQFPTDLSKYVDIEIERISSDARL